MVNFINPTVIGGQSLVTNNSAYNTGFYFSAESGDCHNVNIDNLIVKLGQNNYGKYTALRSYPNNLNDYKIYNIRLNGICSERPIYLPFTFDLSSLILKNVNYEVNKTTQQSIIGGSSLWYNTILSEDIVAVRSLVKFLLLPDGIYEWNILNNSHARSAYVDLTDFDSVYQNGALQSSKYFSVDTSIKSSKFKMKVINGKVYIFDCIGTWTPTTNII